MFDGEKELWLYENQDGKAPFEIWIESLRDHKARDIIWVRLDRLKYGHAGKCRLVGMGVFELKIFFGPGYRVYYGEENDRIIILLCGGDKSTQARDIQKACQYWRNYKVRK